MLLSLLAYLLLFFASVFLLTSLAMFFRLCRKSLFEFGYWGMGDDNPLLVGSGEATDPGEKPLGSIVKRTWELK